MSAAVQAASVPSDGAQGAETSIDARALVRELAPYRDPDTRRSLFELTITVIPFLLLWALTWLALDSGYWLGLVLMVPAAGFLLRIFLIQHDCGHGSFFRTRAANDWVGRVLAVFTLTPYDYWKRSHALHHASTGNLGGRGVGDIDTLTVEEFRALSPARRRFYRVYRHPLVMFGVGPAYLFLLRHRLPIGMMREGWGPWLSAMLTNAGVLALAAALVWKIGLASFLLVHLPITLLAASAGVWLFYVQHQFEHTLWDRPEDWNFHDAALLGSSHYVLPAVLRWFTANIGVHHVHHLASRVPFYRLPEVLRDHPQLNEVCRITFRDSLKGFRLALWDEEKRRLVSFREARA